MSVQHDGHRPVNRFAADDSDVILVIGSGAGGGTVANELCQRGARVVLLEAGKHHQPQDFINDEWPSLDQLAWLDERTTSGTWRIAKDFPKLPAWTCKAVGGTTVHGRAAVRGSRSGSFGPAPSTVRSTARVCSTGRSASQSSSITTTAPRTGWA